MKYIIFFSVLRILLGIKSKEVCDILYTFIMVYYTDLAYSIIEFL